jgi:hypothetical protein
VATNLNAHTTEGDDETLFLSATTRVDSNQRPSEQSAAFIRDQIMSFHRLKK